MFLCNRYRKGVTNKDKSAPTFAEFLAYLVRMIFVVVQMVRFDFVLRLATILPGWLGLIAHHIGHLAPPCAAPDDIFAAGG